MLPTMCTQPPCMKIDASSVSQAECCATRTSATPPPGLERSWRPGCAQRCVSSQGTNPHSAVTRSNPETARGIPVSYPGRWVAGREISNRNTTVQSAMIASVTIGTRLVPMLSRSGNISFPG